MLAIDKQGNEYSIQPIKDCEENADGAYCEVYPYDKDGESANDYTDFFCIHKEDCPNEGVWDEYGGLTAEAETFATNYIKSNF